MKKGKEKRRKITLKTGKGLKNASFWAINSKKLNLKRGGGEEMIRMHNTYPCLDMNSQILEPSKHFEAVLALVDNVMLRVLVLFQPFGRFGHKIALITRQLEDRASG